MSDEFGNQYIYVSCFIYLCDLVRFHGYDIVLDFIDNDDMLYGWLFR